MMDWFRAAYDLMSRTDEMTWWAHLLINASGTAVGWIWLGPWPGVALLLWYGIREVLQIRKRGYIKWHDDVPDFISAALGFFLVYGLIT